jgi:hypothetical protein
VKEEWKEGGTESEGEREMKEEWKEGGRKVKEEGK